jgi:hypothetical protein
MADTWSEFKPSRPSVAATWDGSKRINHIEWEIVRQALNGLASRRGDPFLVIGGARTDRHLHTAATAYDHPNYWDVLIDWTRISTGWTVAARVETITNAVGGSVTPRIRNRTDSVDITGTASTSVTWAEQFITIPAPGVLGLKRYRLQLLNGDAAIGINAVGAIEVYVP